MTPAERIESIEEGGAIVERALALLERAHAGGEFAPAIAALVGARAQQRRTVQTALDELARGELLEEALVGLEDASRGLQEHVMLLLQLTPSGDN